MGLSLDGPRELHDAYRRDKRGGSVFDKVVGAVRLMQRHRVEFNVLCTVNAVNSRQPLEVYRFFRDELGARYIQFIPIVERANDSGARREQRSPSARWTGEQYGRFLIEIFDEWVGRDVGEVFVLFFDGVLAAYVRGTSSSLRAPAHLRRGGGPRAHRRRLLVRPLRGARVPAGKHPRPTPGGAGILGAAAGVRSGQSGHACRAIAASVDGCSRATASAPRTGCSSTPDGEPGLNWLCEGLQDFFVHTEHPMRIMADLLKRGRPAAEVMTVLAEEERRVAEGFAAAERNDPCPCGSGKKYKRCHGA